METFKDMVKNVNTRKYVSTPSPDAIEDILMLSTIPFIVMTLGSSSAGAFPCLASKTHTKYHVQSAEPRRLSIPGHDQSNEDVWMYDLGP